MNFPEAFIQQIKINHGDDAGAFMHALNQQEEVVSIRINKNKIHAHELAKVPWCQTGFYLPVRPSFTIDPVFHSGAYYVQEASSMFLEQTILQLGLDKKNCRILDLCASPGGKSTHLISLINDESLLVSNEVIRSRTAVLAENLSKWGKPNYMVTSNDAKDFSNLENYFDAIVCDAPCSGEGMFRKDAYAVNVWSEENVLHCAQRQKRIVADVWDTLKPGGYFIYSTCTFNKFENEENVKWICETLGAELIPIALNKSWGIVDNTNCYHLYPHKVRGEGFFIAVLQKKNDGDEIFSPSNEKSKQKKNNVKSLKDFDQFRLLINEADKFDFIIENNISNIFPTTFAFDLSLLKQHLRIIDYGTNIGQIKGKDIIPHQSLAQSLFLNANAFEKINLNLTEALRYLKGETNFNLACDNGWILICYLNQATQKSYPLGFAKKIGTRINNHYPKNRMIRMAIDYEKIKASIEEAFVYPFES